MMVKTIKPMIALFLVMLFVIQGTYICGADSQDADNDQSQIRYTYIAATYCSCNISGLTATCRADLTCRSSCYMTIKMELQKLKSGCYSTIQTWNTSNTGTYLTITKTKLINVLSTYRLKVTFAAGSETVTAYAYP
ncbi:MAG: hypothetical protein K6G90_04535 [Clostridia bacterium]|nr:hypothetical protein [Clostridia bacterium]